MTHGHAALLLLADGRLPAGGYAHSGGLEPSVLAQRVADTADYEAFLVGRIETAGLLAATFAAAACARATDDDMDAVAALAPELEARTPSAELRSVSRTLGRQLLRTMQAIHPHPYFDVLASRSHQPIVMGVAAAALDLEPKDAALAVLHETAAGPAAAAPKIMSIDPFDVHAALVRVIGRLDQLAEAAAERADDPPQELPAPGAPLLDIAAEHHRGWNVRLFAS